MKRRLFLMTLAGIPLSFKALGRPAKENIILLSVDTLRADRLGCYGYHLPTSPHIDRLVAQGVQFTDAITNVPLTTPSFASLFTSLYPHETGSIRNGIPMVDGIPTLTQIFHQHDYHTAAILSNWPLKRHLSNFHHGFDFYEDDFNEKRWIFFNDERDARGVTECALAWLEKKAREPFFAWIHYSDPHSPYRQHKDFKFESGDQNNSNYDSEVAYTDHYIGKLLDEFRRRGILGRSLVVFFADHGESLGEHNYVGHGRNVYQPSLHVPFALIGPGIPSAGKSDVPVQLLDLMPTVLAYAGLPGPAEMRGLNLLPRLRREEPYPERSLYYETYSGAAPQVPGAEKSLTKPLWVGFKQGREKVMFSIRYQRWERYALESDPHEEVNLVKLSDPDFRAKSDQLLAWYREWEDKTVIGNIQVMTKEDRERFRALGYTDNP